MSVVKGFIRVDNRMFVEAGKGDGGEILEMRWMEGLSRCHAEHSTLNGTYGYCHDH